VRPQNGIPTEADSGASTRAGAGQASRRDRDGPRRLPRGRHAKSCASRTPRLRLETNLGTGIPPVADPPRLRPQRTDELASTSDRRPAPVVQYNRRAALEVKAVLDEARPGGCRKTVVARDSNILRVPPEARFRGPAQRTRARTARAAQPRARDQRCGRRARRGVFVDYNRMAAIRPIARVSVGALATLPSRLR